MNNIATRTLTAAALLAAFGAPLAFAGPASASGGGGDVRNSGTCVGGGTFQLKAKHDDGRIEVEYEVDTNRAGQIWQVRITDNGVTVANRSARTVAPSGSFELRSSIANRAGTDALRATATFGSRSCGGHVTL